jgi:hypothetical protein
MEPHSVVKPIARADTWCPFWKQRTSKVCHTCAFYLPIAMEAKHPQGNERADVWDCAIKHQLLVQLDTGRRVERAAAEGEKTANEMHGFRRSVVGLVSALAQVPAPQLPPAQGGKLIEQDGG